MKLYYSKGACSLAIRILIHEIGISCEFESVDLVKKITENGDDYFKINPKGYVPCLYLDNGEYLTENVAIQIYLAEEYKATQLLPTMGNFNRYRVIEWTTYVSTELHKGAGPLFNPSISPEEKNEIFIPVYKKKLDFVEQQLANRKYLVGNDFTLPDAYLFVILSWLHKFKLELSNWPNLARYFEELKNRKSVAQSLREEGLRF